MAAALCALATPAALAEKAAPSNAGPAANQAPKGGREQSWPKLLPDKVVEATPVPRQWSPQDIELAQARCRTLLKSIDAIVVPETPIREGPDCGAPAPMKLVSLGKSPQVALSPPPTVTCDMIVALHRWLERDVQPLARKHLGQPVIRIETMSSYSCRNAYGRTQGRLSEHGKANAVDIGSFVTARGQAAMVVADWGPTAREIAAQATAEKDQAKASRQPAAPQEAAVASQPAGAGVRVLRPGMTVTVPGVTVHIPGITQPKAPELGLGQPNHLGGPKPAAAARVIDPDARMDFLRAAHRTACKIFGTVLGPEANNAHKNHFHVDMAERVQHTKICE